jgi:hypothetical protein
VAKSSNRDVPGTFTYTPEAGTVLPLGVHTLRVDFVPADTGRYRPVRGVTVQLTVRDPGATPAPIRPAHTASTPGAAPTRRLTAARSWPTPITAHSDLSAPVSGEVAGTEDDVLYQTGRHGAFFTYNVPVANGTYDVTLHFAETYWGNLVAGGVGSRRFKVDLEEKRVLTEYDIFEKAGGAMKPIRETFRTTVSDGRMSIRFRSGSANLARISAIEIIPAGEAQRPTVTARNGAAGTEVEPA